MESCNSHYSRAETETEKNDPPEETPVQHQGVDKNIERSSLFDPETQLHDVDLSGDLATSPAGTRSPNEMGSPSPVADICIPIEGTIPEIHTSQHADASVVSDSGSQLSDQSEGMIFAIKCIQFVSDQDSPKAKKRFDKHKKKLTSLFLEYSTSEQTMCSDSQGRSGKAKPKRQCKWTVKLPIALVLLAGLGTLLYFVLVHPLHGKHVQSRTRPTQGGSKSNTSAAIPSSTNTTNDTIDLNGVMEHNVAESTYVYPTKQSAETTVIKKLNSSQIAEISELLLTISRGEVLNNPSPQNKSAEWILNQDVPTLFVDAHGSVMKIKVIQRYALGTIYFALNGTEWDYSGATYKWLDGKHECNWMGVICDGNDRVEQLRMGSKNLTGEVPPEIVRLDKLTTLDLFSNALSGTIPPLPSSIVNLNLEANKLEGSIPKHFFALANLTFVNLSGNRLSGSISNGTGTLTKLTDFLVSGNSLSGKLPAALGEMVRLSTFEANKNNFRGSMPSELGKLENLRLLDLSYNELRGSIPVELSNLPELRHLDLQHNRLTGTLPFDLGGNVTKLVELRVNNNQLTGNIPGSFGDCQKLESLFAHDNRMSGSVPLSVCQNDKLSAFTMDCLKRNVSCSCCTRCY